MLIQNGMQSDNRGPLSCQYPHGCPSDCSSSEHKLLPWIQGLHARSRASTLNVGAAAEDAAQTEAAAEAAGGLRIPLAHLLKKSAPIDMAGSVHTPADPKKPAGPAWGAEGARGASPPPSGMHPSLRSIQVRPYCCHFMIMLVE